MAEDLFQVLTRFHREVVLPDLDSRIGVKIDTLRDEMLSHFDAVYKRLDRLESEYQALSAAVARIEARMVSRAEFEREISDLKQRVNDLQERIARLEADL